MKENKLRSEVKFLILALTYLFTTFITTPLYLRLVIEDYNPFSDGFDIRFLVSLTLWILVYSIIYLVLHKLFLKIKTKK